MRVYYEEMSLCGKKNMKENYLAVILLFLFLLFSSYLEVVRGVDMTYREEKQRRVNPWGLLQGWNQIHRVSKNETHPLMLPTILIFLFFILFSFSQPQMLEKQSSKKIYIYQQKMANQWGTLEKLYEHMKKNWNW